MIRLFHAYVPVRTFVLGVSEACLIVISFVVAAVFRLGTNEASVTLQYEHGFLKILALTAAFILCMHYFDLYDSSVLSSRIEVWTRLLQVLGSVCILLAFVYYFYPPLELGRGIVLIGLPIVLVLLILWRGVFAAFNRGLRFACRVSASSIAELSRPCALPCTSTPREIRFGRACRDISQAARPAACSCGPRRRETASAGPNTWAWVSQASGGGGTLGRRHVARRQAGGSIGIIRPSCRRP